MVPESIKSRKNKKNAKMSDSEIITIALTGEAMSIDSERARYRFVKKNYSALFPEI